MAVRAPRDLAAAMHPAPMDTVRISTPQSLLRLLPHLVGTPEPPSLIVLPFTEGRSGMPMTLDLPDPGCPGDAFDGCAIAIDRGAPHADALVLIAVVVAPIGSGSLPLRDELRALAGRLEEGGWHVRELLVLGPDAWGDYTHPDAARGPLAELDLLDNPASGLERPRAVPPVPERADGPHLAAVDAHLDTVPTPALHAAMAAPIEALELALDQVQRLGSGGGALGVDPARAVALAVLLVQLPHYRDVAIDVALDGVDRARESVDDPDGPAAERAAERILGIGPAPDPERLHDRLDLWSAIAAATPLDHRAPVLVIVGFLHYFLGRARTAVRCADLAQALDPALTMAPLLRQVVDTKLAPDWVLAHALGGSKAA